jgi:hypothetical protein
MAPAGQTVIQAEQRVHFSCATCAFPSTILMAPSGQLETQTPHPVQRSSLIQGMNITSLSVFPRQSRPENDSAILLSGMIIKRNDIPP